MRLAWKSVVLAFVLVVVISVGSNSSTFGERAAKTLLSPGITVAARLGFGPHDIGLMVVGMLADLAAYSAAMFVILWVMRTVSKRRAE